MGWGTKVDVRGEPASSTGGTEGPATANEMNRSINHDIKYPLVHGQGRLVLIWAAQEGLLQAVHPPCEEHLLLLIECATFFCLLFHDDFPDML